MPVQSDTPVVSFGEWTLRVRRATETPARLLLLVHGWTGDENSMWVFVNNFPGSYWIVAPRGSYATSPSGYSWRSTHAGSGGRPSFDDLKPSVEALIDFVDAYASENSLHAAQFDVMGFSQGAALVSSMALLQPERIRRMAVLAGFVPEGAEPLVEARPLDGKPCFVAHGTLDEMVKIDVARRSVQLLEQAGAAVTYCEDEVGHKLSARCLRALHAFFG